MSAARAFPAVPSLEFERKSAKRLLRQLRDGDADAFARARERDAAFATRAGTGFALADAQLIIAREYGFASWPRLVRYFEEFERVRLGRRVARSGGADREGAMVHALIAEHREHRTWTARALAAYVPRFYGLTHDEIFATAITDDEARLAWARSQGATSWDSLVTQPVPDGPRDLDAERALPFVQSGDLGGLQRLVTDHPELLRPRTPAAANQWSLPRAILWHERPRGREAMRPFVDWLASEGIDIHAVLSEMLCGRMAFPLDDIRWLLERGAEPSWVAPNGIPLLEHVLLLYWNPEGVDLVAARVRPRRALWIAAGLGDIDGVRRSLDQGGHPRPEAVALRPPFDAVGAPSLGSHPEPSEEELFAETLFVAAINRRLGVIEYLASRGAPIDSMVFGAPLINVAVGNGWADVVETLLRAGASVELRGWRPSETARELARGWEQQFPDDPARRRIRELCDLAPGPGRR